MKYLVYTPFRCGSSYLTRFLEKNTNSTAVFYDNYKNKLNDQNLVLKAHECPLDFCTSFDYLFTCIRKPTEIFTSAFIKDFKTIILKDNSEEKYPYFYEGDVSIDKVDSIIDFFMSFNWESFEWLSYDFNFSQIEKLTNINLWNENFDKIKGYNIFQSNPKLIVVRNDIMFNTDKFINFQELCREELKFKNLDKGIFSYRNKDQYGDFYYEFLNKIPEDFYKKYKNLDDQIINKFYQ